MDNLAHADDADLVEHAAPDLVPEPAVNYVRPAGVRIPLTHPFRLGNRLVEEIVIPPVSLGVALDVQAGAHETLLDVLVAATGEPLALFRALRGGDEDVVIGAFVTMLPQSIRDLIVGGS